MWHVHVWGKTEVLYRPLVSNAKEWLFFGTLSRRLKDDIKKDLDGPGWNSMD